MEWKKKIQNIGGSGTVLLPNELMKFLNLKFGDEIVITDDKGKYGEFIAIWNPKQQIEESVENKEE